MIHFYFGENDFEISEQIKAIKRNFAGKHGAENILSLDGATIDVQQLISEIVNINLFSPQRLIIVKNLVGNKSAWQALGENLERIPDYTELIITETKPDKRTKTFTTLKKLAKTKEFPALKAFQLPDFVMREAEKQGVVLKREAVGELILVCGCDQWRIYNELKKFRALDKVVNPKLIRRHVEADISANAFKLLEDALNSRTDSALAELQKLRKSEDPNKFFALLASQFFALAVAFSVNGRSAREIASDCKIHPFVAEKMLQTARKLSKKDLVRISRIIAETDQKLKSTGADPWTLIEIAISKI